MRYAFRCLFLVLMAITLWSGNANAQEGFGLQLIKDGTPVAEANGPMNYTLVVFNNSVDECEASDGCTVILTDVFPTDFVFQSVVATKFFSEDPEIDITGGCSHNNGTNTLTCDLGEFQVVEGCGFFCFEFPTPFVQVQIVGLAPPGTGTITNNAMVAAQGPSGLDPDTASFDTSVVGSFPQPDLVISKADAVDPIIGGTTATYNLTVFNAGNAVANNAFIRDILPPGTTFNSGSPGCVEMPPASNRVTCPLGAPIPPGGFRVRTITINVGNPLVPAVIQNIARVASDEPDSDPSSNITIEPTQVVPAGPDFTQSDLVVTKTSPDTVIVGQEFSYVVNIFNVGPDDADNVRFRDAPFMNTIIDIPGIISNLPANCVSGMAPPNFRCDLLVPLPAGQSVSFIVPATYVGPLPFAPDPTPIFNVANAILGPSTLPNTIQEDPVPENNTFVEVTNVLPPQPEITESDLVITKNAPDVIVPNQQFGYFIQLVNLGRDTAQNVIVRDIIPDDVVFDTLPAGCNIIVNAPPVSDIMRCDVGDLATGEEIILSWRARYTGVVPSLPLFRPVFNLADVDFGPVRGVVQIDPETSNNTSVAISRAIEPPPNINFVDLFVVKVDSPDPVVTGETLTYSLFVYNFGPNDAVDVLVTDILPAGVTVTNDGGCTLLGQVLTCNVDLIMAGMASIIQIEVEAPALMDDEPIMILNAARADVNPFALLESQNTIQLDFAPSNNTDSEKTTVVPEPPPMSDLLILKTDTPDPVIEDEVLTYTIFVKNTGPDPAFGVLVSDWLPQEGLDLDTVNFTFSPNVDGCIQDPDVLMEPYKVECLIPSLGVEESATINVTVTTLPLPDGVEFLNIFNLAKVESIGDEINPPSADPNPLNNVVVESTLIGEFVPVADLFIIKSDSPDPVFVDQTLTYVLFVSNAGKDPATNVVVTDTLPDSVDLISATPDQGACGGLIGDTVTCNLGNLAVGAFTEIRILVTPRIPGTILNVAQVMGDEHDPKSSNNISPQTTTVNPRIFTPPDNPGEPNGNDIFVLKFVSPNPVEVGQEVTFTIIVGNNGEFGSGATVVDDLPAGLTFVSATANTGDPCNLVNGDVVCDIGTIPPLGQGQTVVVEVRAIANQTGTLPNTAFLDNVPNDPVTNNNVSIVALTVVPDISAPQPPPNPDPGDDGDDGDNGGTGGSTNNNGCAVASGSINTSSTAINFALLLLPLLVFGFRSRRRKK